MSDDNDPSALLVHLTDLEQKLTAQSLEVQRLRGRGSYDVGKAEAELDRLLDKWIGVRNVLVLHDLDFEQSRDDFLGI